jgi:enoyl-CoA hydratase/long-chain 3-hydroxyacyl-CoA dehydrogenase
VSVAVAKDIASGKLKVDRKKKSLTHTLLDFGLTFNWVRNQVFGRAKKEVLKLSGGLYPAPLRVSYSQERMLDNIVELIMRN